MRAGRARAPSPFRLIPAFAFSLFLLLPGAPRTAAGIQDTGSVLPASPPPTWEEVVEALSERLADDVAADGVGGIAAGIVVDGDLVWARGYGWSDRAARTPMRPAAVSRTGSISKTVTAMLLLRLVDRGVVGLDDPVERYLPEFGAVGRRHSAADSVTLRQLASHTAGLAREPSNLREMVSGAIDRWEERVIESLRNTVYDTLPGVRYQYSNIGFGALGLALSRAAERPFMDLVAEEIFTPLGMTGTAFIVVDGELEPRLATGYVNRADGSVDTGPPAGEHAGRGYKVPNGGVYSTVADLGRFLGAISGVPGLDILSFESRRAMVSIQTPESETSGYGLGLSVQIGDDGQRIVGHGGSVAGYTAFMAVDPDTGVGAILLRNYQRGETNLGEVVRGLVTDLSQLTDLEAAGGAAPGQRVPEPGRDRIYALLPAAESVDPKVRTFVVPGADHGLLRSERFYDYQASGVLLADWVRAAIDGGQPPTVRPDAC